MGKVSFNLPIRGGRGQPNELQNQRLSPHMYENALPDYTRFPYSTFFPKNREDGEDDKPEDPLLDKSSPEYRVRAEETLDILQREYQWAYDWYKDVNRSLLLAREGRAQLLWNMAVLDLHSVSRRIQSKNPVHGDVVAVQREIRHHRTLEYNMKRERLESARRGLLRIEAALEAGLRELARLDGVDSEAFHKLRSVWARRQSRECDDKSQPSSCLSYLSNIIAD